MKALWDRVNFRSRFVRGGVNQKLTFENRDRERNAITHMPTAKAVNTLFNTFLIEMFRWSRRFIVLFIRFGKFTLDRY